MVARFRLYVAVSVDGYIATPDGGVAWLESFTSDYGYDAFFASIGQLVMGRATYDQVRELGAWPYEGKPTYVLSSRAITDAPPGVERWPWGVPKLCEQLRAKESGDVWIVGGGKTVRGFLEAGTLDEVELYVMPRLLGDGIRLFEAAESFFTLNMVDTHAYPDGVVRLRYRTAGPEVVPEPVDE
jgi:dihydrofolate reductase